jgi:hypothetical protein
MGGNDPLYGFSQLSQETKYFWLWRQKGSCEDCPLRGAVILNN